MELYDTIQDIPHGTIVHYHNGFGAYVRGIITYNANETAPHLNDIFFPKGIRPVALVGAWNKHDLPYRQSDGTIYLPHHPKRILIQSLESVFTPADSNIFECREFDRNRYNDPRRLPAIDLTIPDPTPEELQQIEKVRLLKQICSIAVETDYDMALQKIASILKENGYK